MNGTVDLNIDHAIARCGVDLHVSDGRSHDESRSIGNRAFCEERKIECRCQQRSADQDHLEEDAERVEDQHAPEQARGLALERAAEHQRRRQRADGEHPVHGVAAAHARGIDEHDQEHGAGEDDFRPEPLQAGDQGAHVQPRRKSASSRFGVRRSRYMVSTMARATATSAAAMTTTKIAKSCPCRFPGP